MAEPFVDLAEQSRLHGLVVLAGAGISMPPPSCLPGWTDFNDAVLTALARRGEQLTGGRLTASETMIGLQTVRDQMGALAIDFQAQLMQEECGADYFRVLQSIDADAPNDCHYALAALAGTGVLKAIVTTNFDRLIERALDARGVSYRVFRHPEEFDALEAALAAGGLAVIKVHGSVESPDSMVDTLRQRIQGRPEALVRALAGLFERHALLVAGFSGADLAYDPEYLGLRAGTAHSPLVVVITREGSQPLPAMTELVDHCQRGRLEPGSLPGSLVNAASALGAATTGAAAPADAAPIRASRLASLSAGVAAWVDTLGDATATNILGAVLEGATTTAAFYLLREARGNVLHVSDRKSAAYWRYQVNYGRHLLERGYLGQDLPVAETLTAIDAGQLDDGEFDDAFRILARATFRANRNDAPSLLARLFAYRGEYPTALQTLKHFRQLAIGDQHSLAIAEIFISAATVHALMGNWSGGLEFLEMVYPAVQRFGDEPRRARLCAHLGRFLAWAERYDEAERRLQEGEAIAKQLKLGIVLAEVHAAWGYLEIDRGRPAEAVAHLAPATRTFDKADLLSPLLPALLDLSEAAFSVDKNELSMNALGAVERELDRYPGLLPHYHYRVASLLTRAGRFADARTFIARAKTAGQHTGNDWAVTASDKLAQKIQGKPDVPA